MGLINERCLGYSRWCVRQTQGDLLNNDEWPPAIGNMTSRKYITHSNSSLGKVVL